MRHYTKFLFSFLVPVVFLSFSCAQVISEKSDVPTETDLISDKAKASIVRLVGSSVGGTGFFIAPDKITTNFHVVAGNTIGPIFAKSKLEHKETTWTVEGVMAFDIKSDIAILKVQDEGVPLSLADVETLQIGEAVFIAGYPNLGEYKVTEGFVQNICNSDKQFDITAETYPGNSGSPVLNSKGEVIGIHYGHDPGNSPVNAIKTLLTNSLSTQPLEQWRNQKIVRAFVYYKQGKKKYYNGDPKAAITDFNKGIELSLNNPQTYRYRAKAKAKLEDYKAAIEDYDQSIKLNPNNASAYKERGKAKQKISDYEGAIDDYNQAIRLNPKDVFGYSGRAAIKRELGDYAGAIEDYAQVIELMRLNPDDLDPLDPVELDDIYYYIYCARGLAKHEFGDDTGAIEDFTHAIERKPDYPTAYHLRGHSKQDLGQEEAAQIDFEKALELESAQ